MMNEIVSVIIPCFNSEDVIEKSVNSVLEQTYQNIEVLIVDDGSQDSTLDVLKKYDDPRLHVYSLPNNTGSPTKPRNIGISKATGKYIAFLDSDDFWEPNKLEVQLKFMRENKSPFCCTSYTVIGSNGLNHRRRVPKYSSFSDTLILNTIGCSTVIIERSLISRYMFLDIRLEDYNLWLTILQDGYSILGVDECLTNYVQNEGSRSKFDMKQAKAYVDTFRRFGKPNLLSALLHCCQYLLRRLIWAKL
ncbi:glycosyltransferase family 2 protein [Vibrio paucivorans]